MQYDITEKNVKLIGRTCMEGGICWFGHAGSGIAFRLTGTKVRMVIAGDDTTQGNETEGKARIGICVNGKRMIDMMIEQPEQTVTVLESDVAQEITVQVIKLSECAMSVAGIKCIEAEVTDGLWPVPEKERRIEFIGDSITCGFGVDLEDPDTAFQTGTEDVTKAYAYQTAEILDADYSMVSFSGYGVWSGYTDTGERQEEQLVPRYYEKVGFSYGKPFGTVQLQEIPWEFSKYRPQLVVVNLGTNDDSYCKDEAERRQQFSEKYVEFLKQIHKNNPQAVILCIAGLMGTRIYSAISGAVDYYKQTEASGEIYAMMLEEQLPEDGRVSSGHPTEISHEKAAIKTANKIREIMNW